MAEPRFASPIPAVVEDFGAVQLVDESTRLKWRIWEDLFGVGLGRGRRFGDSLAFSVSPGEWIVLGDRPDGSEVVDITHVRAAMRLTGPGARALLGRVCALDLSDAMTPDLAAARTLVAGVATELVRDDVEGEPSYLLLMSRSFAQSVHERLVATAQQP